jgi:hypothetical protein
LIGVRDVVNKEQKPHRLVNESGVSIHHVASRAAIWRSAFIFDEREASWLISGFHAVARGRAAVPAVNFVLNRFCLQRRVSEVGGVS